MDPTRRMVQIGFSSDVQGALSGNLGSKVKLKAHCLQTQWRQPNGLVDVREGQVGLIRHKNGDEIVLTPITCKSHFHSTSNEEIYGGATLLPANHTASSRQLSVFLPFEEAPSLEDEATLTLNEEVTWRYGIDILEGTNPVSPTCFEDILTKSSIPTMTSFERVRSDFKYAVGQQIGVAVYSLKGATPRTAGVPDMSQAEVTKIFGKPGKVHIYTGSIRKVGAHHIEHDINTFESCKGAVIFLLDRNQPGGVLEGDHEKAIAIDAGDTPGYPLNIAFKLLSA